MQPTLNHLHLGDCTHVMRHLPEGSVDLIVTDPPYLVNYRDRHGRSIANDRNSDWLKPAFTEMFRVLRRDRFVVSFYGWNHADKFITA